MDFAAAGVLTKIESRVNKSAARPSGRIARVRTVAVIGQNDSVIEATENLDWPPVTAFA
jgi:hypothetical protein